MEAHVFVPSDYWLSQYPWVQEQLLQADSYVSEQDKMPIVSKGIDADAAETDYTMAWNQSERESTESALTNGVS